MEPAEPDLNDLVQIGRVIKPHGVRGEVAVEVTTDDPAGRFSPGTVLVGRQGGRARELTVATIRPHQGRLLVSFEEIPDRTAAESLRGLRFLAAPVPADEDEDAYYDHKLIGLRVIDGTLPEPVAIGKVVGVTRSPAHQLLEVAVDGGSVALVPFVHALVPVVDLDGGNVVITPPEGLLDL